MADGTAQVTKSVSKTVISLDHNEDHSSNSSGYGTMEEPQLVALVNNSNIRDLGVRDSGDNRNDSVPRDLGDDLYAAAEADYTAGTGYLLVGILWGCYILIIYVPNWFFTLWLLLALFLAIKGPRTEMEEQKENMEENVGVFFQHIVYVEDKQVENNAIPVAPREIRFYQDANLPNEEDQRRYLEEEVYLDARQMTKIDDHTDNHVVKPFPTDRDKPYFKCVDTPRVANVHKRPKVFLRPHGRTRAFKDVGVQTDVARDCCHLPPD